MKNPDYTQSKYDYPLFPLPNLFDNPRNKTKYQRYTDKIKLSLDRLTALPQLPNIVQL